MGRTAIDVTIVGDQCSCPRTAKSSGFTAFATRVPANSEPSLTPAAASTAKLSHRQCRLATETQMITRVPGLDMGS